MRQNGFEPEFSADVIREVADSTTHALRRARETCARCSGRRSTIGNRATSIRSKSPSDLDDGAIRIRIGVADVGTLVPQGSAADTHAASNTTSVYAGVAVFPMLPERLSTDLHVVSTKARTGCAVIIEFDVAPDGDAEQRRRLSRPAAQPREAHVQRSRRVARRAGPRTARDSRDCPVCASNCGCRTKPPNGCGAARNRAGALNFESVEASPVVVNGRVVDLAVARRNRARDLIEDFMVAANRTVATYLLDHGSRVAPARRARAEAMGPHRRARRRRGRDAAGDARLRRIE